TLNGALLWRGGKLVKPTLLGGATTTNLLKGASPDKIIANDPPAVDDTALTNPVTLPGPNLSPSPMASNKAPHYTVDGAGSLAASALGMQGTGSLALANTAANTLGSVIVNSGSLTIANSGQNSVGSLTVNAGSLTIANSAPNVLGNVALTNGTLTIAN